ncbi:MAG: hypothetical protein A2096_16035 [Spirochaetes bacterium GWF1_41_5]|nr:MAG: hypothetical protein A2096_16035 [Spirochaetes bacterium GWF1_41_5]
MPDIIRLPSNRVWRTYPGGKFLDVLDGKQTASDDHFPEDWIASTTRAVNKGREHLTDEGISRVAVEDGKKITELFAYAPQKMLGEKHFSRFGANSGFLLKFLDSQIRLHIQCHPTVEFAEKYLNSSSGKTEGYYILKIRDEVLEPYIYLGFQEPPGYNAYKKAICQQDQKSILAPFQKIPVKPGDAFIVPGGLPHAIGEGIFMVEIMEPTDFAVRIEFERGGYILPEASRFMGRDVDFALSMFDFTAYTPEKIKEKFFIKPQTEYSGSGSIIDSIFDTRSTACFRVKHCTVKNTLCLEKNSFLIVIILSGSGKIQAGAETLEAKIYDKFFIPFGSANVRLLSETGMECLCALPPEV